MTEIGGYIEFEHYHGKEFHDNAIKLNCARNCLAYLIKLHKIERIYIPYFLCDSVLKVCKKYGVEVYFYHIDENFQPLIPSVDFSKDWLYVVNYYGQLSNKRIADFAEKYKNIIIDNVQSFFQKPVAHVPTIYTCRKFFGVSDGAYLYSNQELEEELELDISYNRMSFLLGRYEKTASEFYPQYVANNELFETEPIKQMSVFTENIMQSMDYKRIKNVRTDNFEYLHKKLKSFNKLDLLIPEGAFAYPLFIDSGASIRKKLQMEKIYIPTLWPDVFDLCNKNELEYQIAENILPIPVDQRYGIKEMELISEVLFNFIK